MGIPLLAAAAAGVVGNLISGRSKAKAARRQQKLAENAAKADQSRALELRELDQAEARKLAESDEVRARHAHAEAVGYDLIKLRDDAQASGFNPLTILANTAGANYARTAAPVISTPFAARPFVESLSAVLGTGQARVDSAGYFGDAISGGASAYIGIAQETARLAADREMAAAIRSERQQTFTGGTGRAAFPVEARQVDARPVQGPLQPVRVQTPWGWRKLNASAAARIGITDGEWMTGGDYEELLGEIGGEINSGADLVGPGGPFLGVVPRVNPSSRPAQPVVPGNGGFTDWWGVAP